MSDQDLESIEDPAVVEHPDTAPPRRVIRWVVALAILVVVALGVSLAITHDRPLAERVARQNTAHSSVTPMMMAPPPRHTSP